MKEKKDSKTMPSHLNLLLLSTTLLSLSLPATSLQNSDLITSLGSVPRRHITASSAFPTVQEYLQSVASNRRPLVITGYDVDLESWDLGKLVEKGGKGFTMDNVRRNRDGKAGETARAVGTPPPRTGSTMDGGGEAWPCPEMNFGGFWSTDYFRPLSPPPHPCLFLRAVFAIMSPESLDNEGKNNLLFSLNVSHSFTSNIKPKPFHHSARFPLLRRSFVLPSGFVLRKNTTAGGLSTSPTVSVFTPNEESLLFNVDFDYFYNAIEEESEKLYWTGDMRVINGSGLGSSVSQSDDWWRDFQVLDDLQVEEGEEDASVPMLWMRCESSVASVAARCVCMCFNSPPPSLLTLPTRCSLFCRRVGFLFPQK